MISRNVLFGKLGQQIVFNRNLPEAIRSNTNGNYEAYNFLQILSKTLGNVFIVEENMLMTFEQQKNDNKIKLITDFVPKIDCAFIILGFYKQFVSQKLLDIINSGIKWYALCSDPRCLKELVSLITNPPICVFAGANGVKCEIAGKMFLTRYLNIESATIFEEPMVLQTDLLDHKHNKMIVIANQTSTWDRISDVKYMTSMIPEEDVIIYGRCDDSLKDSRFKGEKTIQFIYNSQLLSKVTYIAPISKGWITAKYLECISRGVIPLFSKDYATSIHDFIKIINDVDKRLIVKNPKEVADMFNLIIDDHEYFNFTIYSLRKALYNKYSPIILRENILRILRETK